MASEDIRTRLGLNIISFRKKLNQAGKDVKNWAKNAKDSFAAVAGSLGAGALIASATQLAQEIRNLARLGGATNEEFQRMAAGAEKFNVTQEKLADILKDVNDKVGDFLNTGGGPMKDFFEVIGPKVGVTAEQFKNLSGPQALQLYFDSLEKANLSQADMTFFMEAIASDATLLIPLLQDGGAAIKRFGDEAENLGRIMDEETIQRLADAQVQIKGFKHQITVVTGTILGIFMPLINILGSAFNTISRTIGALVATSLELQSTMFDLVRLAFRPLVTALGAAGQAAIALKMAMAGNLEGAKQFMELSKKGFKRAMDQVKEVPAQARQEFDDLKTFTSTAWDEITGQIIKSGKIIRKNWSDLWSNNEKDVNDAVNAMDQAEEKARKIAAVNRLFEEERKKRAFDRLSATQQLAIVEEKIKKLRLKAAQGDIDAAKELIDLVKERNRLLNGEDEGDTSSPEKGEKKKRRRATVTTFDDVKRESERNRLKAQSQSDGLSAPSSGGAKSRIDNAAAKPSASGKEARQADKTNTILQSIDTRLENLENGLN
jgi:hypothetical protein